MKTNYQRNLINSIKAFGEWISENAEKIGNEIIVTVKGIGYRIDKDGK